MKDTTAFTSESEFTRAGEGYLLQRLVCDDCVDLADCQVSDLPGSPDCPYLTKLVLQRNDGLMDIPISFFYFMPKLEYLDLSYTGIKVLPASISNLTKLKKLYLKGCDVFMELPPEIGQLKELEELDLDETFITHLPKEIRELINLKRLILCFIAAPYGDQSSNSSTIIPPGVISNLGQLNCLSIKVDPEDQRWNHNVVHIWLEILELESLNMVSIYVPKIELLELIPEHKNNTIFRLVVGPDKQRYMTHVTPGLEEKFNYCNNSTIKFVNGVSVPNELKMNLSRFKALYLDRHFTLKSLSEFESKNLNMLQVCILGECNEMESVVSADDTHTLLPALEFLSVYYMKSLKSICNNGTPRFHCLKSIRLKNCPMLTTIFTSAFIRNLSLLEELIIEDCPKVTTIVSHDLSEHGAHILLPRLSTILFLYLPALISIFDGLHVKHSIQEMGFYYCPKLRSLTKSELPSKNSPSIIKGESRWWGALKWNEAEWGCAGRPAFLDQLFSPINEYADIFTQSAPHNHKGH